MYEMFMKNHPYKANNINDLISKIKNNKPLIMDNNMDSKCKELIYNLLVIDLNKRLDWYDIFTNEWIYNDNIEMNNNLEKELAENNSDDMEYSFKDCFNSINYDINKEEKNKCIKYDQDYFKTNTSNTIDITHNVINDYIIVDKPEESNINKLIKNIFSTI